MKVKILFSVLSSLLFAACGDGHDHATGAGHAAGTPPKNDHAAGGHGPLVEIGKVRLGGVAAGIAREGEVQAGQEIGLEVTFPKDKLPGTLRAWVGIESAVGSMKAKLTKESDTVMHGHVDVPTPIPPGSSIWVEIDGPGDANRASIAWKE